jgi:hypothetical protein
MPLELPLGDGAFGGRRVAVAKSSTPRLIGLHRKPGLRGLSPSHLRDTAFIRP